MGDILIRGLPESVVAAIDARARKLGVSRSEYLRRRLTSEAAATGSPVTVDDLARFSDVFPDLTDPEVVRQAWR